MEKKLYRLGNCKWVIVQLNKINYDMIQNYKFSLFKCLYFNILRWLHIYTIYML